MKKKILISGIGGSWIPRKWTLEERNVVERVFGKEALLRHEELLQLIRNEKMSNIDDLCHMNLKGDKETADALEPYVIGKYKFNIKDKGEDK